MASCKNVDRCLLLLCYTALLLHAIAFLAEAQTISHVGRSSCSLNPQSTENACQQE